jgi:hypothetical protein
MHSTHVLHSAVATLRAAIQKPEDDGGSALGSRRDDVRRRAGWFELPHQISDCSQIVLTAFVASVRRFAKFETPRTANVPQSFQNEVSLVLRQFEGQVFAHDLRRPLPGNIPGKFEIPHESFAIMTNPANSMLRTGLRLLNQIRQKSESKGEARQYYPCIIERDR